MNEDRRTRQIRKAKRKRKNISIGILVILIIFIIMLVYSGIMIKNMVENGGIQTDKRLDLPIEKIEVKIEKGDSSKDIAEKLEKAGVIDWDKAFLLKVKSSEEPFVFQYGTFTFTNQMNYDDVIKVLGSINKDVDYRTFLIKEGMTQADIGEQLEIDGIVTFEEFNIACNTWNFEYDFIKEIKREENRLEGYLYPDTYFFTLDADCDEILGKILRRFNEVYNEELRQRTNQLNTTMDEVIIKASIIEREVRYHPERSTVASVIENRLSSGMKLQMDATVLYAKGEHKDRVLESDINIQSNYNTYYIEGLPVGPISNPGLDSIKAVLYPEDTDYIYYVVENDETGKHFFTADYNEFLDAKQRYISKFK